MSPAEQFVVLLMVPAALLTILQIVVQGLVLVVLGRRDFTMLPIFMYLAQWFRPDPAAAYGVQNAAVLHWVIAILFLAVAVTVTVLISRLVASRKRNPQLRPGLATLKDVKRELGTQQLVELRGPKLRPSLANTEISPVQVGYRVGEFLGQEVWSRVEDPTILIGPSRAGKGYRFILGWIVDAPGAVITTSVRMDNAKLTMLARERAGSQTLMWAPGIDGGKDFGKRLKWNPVEGCLHEETLIRRINALVPSGSFAGSTSNGGHWDSLGRQLASHLFHAAACGEVGVDEIWSWVSSTKRAEEAVRMIREHPQGMKEHADHLEHVLNMPHEQRNTNWGVLPTVLAFMESRAARDWMKPAPGESVDLVQFILQRGTIYIVGDKMASPVYVRMNDALLAEFDFITKGLAAASPGSRLDPPVTYVLDEAGNIEYQGMYELITAGGGYGRVGIAAYQSKNQLDQVKDASTAATLWDAAVAKIILPGGGDSKALGEISELIGESWYESESHTLGSDNPTAQLSMVSRAIFTKEEVRTLDLDYAFMFYRNLSPIVARTRPFSDHPRYAECMADADDVDGQFRTNSPYAAMIREASGRKGA